MLRASVYKEIHHQAKNLTRGTFLEIGGASGSASIALCWGFKGDLVVVEKGTGGSRDRIGTWQDNLRFMERNWHDYGISDRVVHYPCNLNDKTAETIANDIAESYGSLIGMMCDADGRIDRDFQWFWPLLRPNALIIIDDYPESPDIPHPKKRLTWYLLNKLKEWGLFEERKRVSDTVFGIRPPKADWSNFDRKSLQRIVQALKAPEGREIW